MMSVTILIIKFDKKSSKILIYTKYLGKRRYSIKIWKIFTDCFNCLPICAIIDEKILCMHGGLSPEIVNME